MRTVLKRHHDNDAVPMPAKMQEPRLSLQRNHANYYTSPKKRISLYFKNKRAVCSYDLDDPVIHIAVHSVFIPSRPCVAPPSTYIYIIYTRRKEARGEWRRRRRSLEEAEIRSATLSGFPLLRRTRPACSREEDTRGNRKLRIAPSRSLSSYTSALCSLFFAVTHSRKTPFFRN